MALLVDAKVAEELLAPLRLHERVLDGFTWDEVTLAEHEQRIHYRFGPSGFRVVLEPRSERPAAARTRSYNLLVPRDDRQPALTEAERGLLGHVTRLLQNNDPGDVVWRTEPTLHLIPGHLGDPMDLGRSAVAALGRMRTVLVEGGKERATTELLRLHGIPSDQKRIVALPGDKAKIAALLEELTAKGEDFCLFGVDEGVPSFCDPGKALLDAAERMAPRLRVCTVGGSSALAMALMRAPFPVDRFMFLGTLDEDGTLPGDLAETLGEYLQAGYQVPLVVFPSRNLASLPARVAEVCLPLGAEVFFACELTGLGERSVYLRPDRTPTPMPTLDPRAHVVLVLRPMPRTPSRVQQQIAPLDEHETITRLLQHPMPDLRWNNAPGSRNRDGR